MNAEEVGYGWSVDVSTDGQFGHWPEELRVDEQHTTVLEVQSSHMGWLFEVVAVDYTHFGIVIVGRMMVGIDTHFVEVVGSYFVRVVGNYPVVCEPEL